MKGQSVSRTVGLLAGTAMLAGAAWGQTVIRVSPSGDDGNDGSDWGVTKRTVQAGLNAAEAGDQVWVAAGTYVECIVLKEGVGLYGGFAGGEEDLSQRDWNTNKTVLDGNGQGPVVNPPLEATRATRIDGFTITNGIASNGGGGINCTYSSPVIANNTVVGNIATGQFCYGGGILCNYQASPLIVNNTIMGNSAVDSSGGGIVCYDSSPTITGNTIIGNSATGSYSGDGGGIYCFQSSVTISGNTIRRNTAKRYGGGIRWYRSSGTIANNLIAENAASSFGSGVSCSYYSVPAILNNTIVSNSGGGISSSYDSTIANNIVAFNYAGINYEVEPGDPTFRNNCVYGNKSYDYSVSPNPTGTNGNVSVDPGFAGREYGNWHLRPDSPCVGAGDNGSAYGDLDLEGRARIQLEGGTVDMGAYESDGSAIPEGPYAIVRVAPDGDDGKDGADWARAKRTVQAGIETATALGGEVWVKTGRYRERIVLRGFSHMYGGFSGGEIRRDQRDFRTNVTILDGQEAGSVVTVGEAYAPSTIDGFTIMNGSGTRTGSSYTSGGGIYCSRYCFPTIANNIIIGNKASSSGGGVCCISSTSLTIANNRITGNAALYGGAISCGSSSAVIVNNIVTANAGGGIRCDDSSATIANNTIMGNRAIPSSSDGGGIHCLSSSPTIVNNIIAFNSSGLFRTADKPGTPTLRHNCVYGNTGYNYSGITDPTGTDGNLSTDPKLASVTHGNWHIQAESPCVDAGDNGAVYGEADMDGQARVQSQGGTVDIGADESDGTVWAEGHYVIVRVSPDGNDGNDGADWSTAKRTVQAGIDAAAGSGGEVWVKDGTYCERIRLHPYAYLYGGFGGDETQRGERDYRVHVTTLDGQQAGSVVSIVGGCELTAIDGFTITNGMTSSGGGFYCYYSSLTIANNIITKNSASEGGGIYDYYSSLRISNNTISENSGSGIFCSPYSSPTISGNTITGNRTSGSGGGIYASSATITGNTITGNSASDGGGVYSTGTISDNVITGNSAISTGGGLRFSGTITRNTISGNSASDGGGVYSFSGTITHNTISENSASGSGGGVYASSATITGNTIAENSASDGGGVYSAGKTTDNTITGNVATTRGGGVWSSGPITGNTITGNIASEGGGVCSSGPIVSNTITGNVASSSGGGIYGDRSSLIVNNTIRRNRGENGGGIYFYFPPYNLPGTIAGNSITGNVASTGGGISCFSSSPEMVNNSIVGNTASDGGGIYFSASYWATVTNTIIAFNSSGIYLLGSEPVRLTLSQNCVYGNTAYNYFDFDNVTGTNGNVSVDPVFVRKPHPGADGEWGTEDDDDGDLRLRSGSACIDAGDNGRVPADEGDVDGDGDMWERLGVDVEGRARFVDDPTADTGVGTGPIVDMGAYERGASVAADLDWDYDVDGFDFLTFANCFNGPGRAMLAGCANAAADLEGDGDVDGADFLTFANCYNGSDRAPLCR